MAARVDISWLMPCWALSWTYVRRTVRPVVPLASMPFLRKPVTARASIVTPGSGFCSVPTTQMPCPAVAQAFSVPSPAVITLAGPVPRRVRPGVVMRTLPRWVPGASRTVSPGRAASTAR